jgi:hypothetical protein
MTTTPRLAWLQLLAALGLHGAAQKLCAKMPPLAPLAVFGGRHGKALSLGSVLAAAIALFLPQSTMAHARWSVANVPPCRAMAPSRDGATLFCVTAKTLTVLDVKTQRVRARTPLASLGVYISDDVGIAVGRNDTVFLVQPATLCRLRPPRWDLPVVETVDEANVVAACISLLNTLVLSREVKVCVGYGGEVPRNFYWQSYGLVCRSTSRYVRWRQRRGLMHSRSPTALCALTFRGIACIAARDVDTRRPCIEVYRASTGKSMGTLGSLRDTHGALAYCAGTDELLIVDGGCLLALSLDTMRVRTIRTLTGGVAATCALAAHGTKVWVGTTYGVQVFDLWR